MANDLQNGASKLVGRILEDARAEAEAVETAAQAEVKKIKELADQSIRDVKQESEARARKLCAEILERSRTNAELDSRKYALAAKRSVLEETFEKAGAGLCVLTGAERDRLLVACALREALGGEAIVPDEADAGNIERLLPAINEGLQKSGRTALSLSGEISNIGNGFLLRGQGYEKNCSFAAMLRDVREAEESNVAAILFK